MDVLGQVVLYGSAVLLLTVWLVIEQGDDE